MCLAIPSKIVAIDDSVATIDVDGVRRTASMLLLEDAGVGRLGDRTRRICHSEAGRGRGPLETIRLLKETVGMIEAKRKTS